MKQAMIESGRAEYALRVVKAIADHKSIDNETKKNYKSYCQAFAGLVLSNGFAASVAFLKDKMGKSKAYTYLYEDITGWLRKNKHLGEQQELEEYVCSLNSPEYRIVTREVIALYEWIRRFASGLIKDDEPSSAKGGASEG